MKKILTVLFAFALFSSVSAAPMVVDDVGDRVSETENVVSVVFDLNGDVEVIVSDVNLNNDQAVVAPDAPNFEYHVTTFIATRPGTLVEDHYTNRYLEVDPEPDLKAKNETLNITDAARSNLRYMHRMKLAC